MNSISRTLSSLAVAGLIAFSSQASAQDADALMAEMPVRKIDVSDYDLSSTQDAQALYQSIRRAARSVCIDQFGGWWNKGTAFKRVSCIREAVDQAVAAVDMPMLRQVHLGAPEAELVASR